MSLQGRMTKPLKILALPSLQHHWFSSECIGAALAVSHPSPWCTHVVFHRLLNASSVVINGLQGGRICADHLLRVEGSTNHESSLYIYIYIYTVYMMYTCQTTIHFPIINIDFPRVFAGELWFHCLGHKCAHDSAQQQIARTNDLQYLLGIWLPLTSTPRSSLKRA